ncbi:hypothetical protein AB6A40_006546 [Gnathostoma spinigerum]|uniref:Uncharacterized protein n=1 Tax=Gnathostoma spinigerum TaxID=75299 RepID=A0ABD6ETG2_9BILA
MRSSCGTSCSLKCFYFECCSRKPGRPEVRPLSFNSRPSEFIGQSVTNAIAPTISKFLGQSAYEENSFGREVITDRSRKEAELAEDNALIGSNQRYRKSPLVDLAEAFLGGSKRMSQSYRETPKQFAVSNKESDPIPTIREFAPTADRNFGIPKGKGCLPFLGEFMQIAYGNCVKDADAKTWDAWGRQLNKALLGGQMDLIKAAQETCKRGAEREHCGQLRKAISECDILGSLQIGIQMQRAIDRCNDVSGIIDQNPVKVLDQVNGIIGGEVAQGFLQRFLG